MADVFISYAREDLDFVRRLHAALAERKLAAWVDWEGIPPTADFLREIHAAIEAADTIVLALSPDWAASSVCSQEAAAALDNGKRLVPLVCREVESDQLPPAVAALNWIFFRESDDFERSFGLLIAAIETDLVRVRALTRLLVRAVEWDKQKRDPSYLLRGVDLVQAEQILAAGESAKPQPTPLQREYVLASRLDAVKRQRRTIGALSGGLVVALLLAALAFWQYRVAEQRRESEQIARLEAERKTRIATSQRLAAQADGALSRFPQRALLLAVEAVNVTRNGKEPVVPDAERSLRRALSELSGRGLGGAGAELISVALSPDSHRLAAAGQSALYLWDFTKPDQRPTVIADTAGTVGRLTFAGGGQWLVGIAMTKNGKQKSIVPVAWNLGAATPSATPLVVPEGVGRLVFPNMSLDDRCILAVTDTGNFVLWDLTSPSSFTNPRVFRPETPADPERLVLTVLRSSANGRWLALKPVAHAVELWDLSAENPALLPLELAGSDGLSPNLLISPDEHWLLAAGADNAVRLWDLTAPDPSAKPRVLRGHEGGLSEAAFSADGRWLVTGSDDRTARVWDLQASDPARRSVVLRGHGDMVRAVSISADGRWVLSSSLVNTLDPRGKFDTTAFLWDMHSREPAATPIQLSGHERGILAAKITVDGQWAITASDSGQVRLWNLQDQNPAAAPLVLRGQQRRTDRLSVSADGRWLISHAEDLSVRVWDLLAPQVAASPLVFAGVGPGLLYPSPDSRWLGISNFNAPAHLLDLGSVNPAASDVAMDDLGRFSEPASDAFLYTSDSRWLVADGEYAASRLFDLTASVAADSARALIDDDGGERPRKAISADNQWLVKIRYPRDPEARLWKLGNSATKPLLLSGHTEAINHVAMSADSHWLATASDDATVRLWNLQAADPSAAVHVLKGHAKRIAGCEFSPDGRWLVTTSDEGTVQLWDLAAASSPRATQLRGYTTAVHGLAFSPDARWLITSGSDQAARLWDLKAARPEATSREFPKPALKYDGASFSPDSRWAVTVDANAAPSLWDLHLQNPLAKQFVLGGHEHGVGFLQISRDNHWLATAGASYATSYSDKVIRLWDLTLADPSEAPRMLLGHERGVSALAMSNDSQWLISGSEDATLRLWNLRAADPADAPIVLSGHRDGIRHIVVSPDSRWLASTSDRDDKDVRLWYLQTTDLTTVARRAAGRNLDLDEWRLFFPGQPYRKTFEEFPSAIAPPER
jgi:WD40 repeat protein